MSWLRSAPCARLDSALTLQLQPARLHAVPVLRGNTLPILLRHAVTVLLGSSRVRNRQHALCAQLARIAQELASQHLPRRARNVW